MARQRNLFERYREPIEPCDPNVVHQQEVRRLTGQNAAILKRLRLGPADNVELAGMALKYTSRISDLRAAGHRVEIIQRNSANGVNVYKLFE